LVAAARSSGDNKNFIKNVSLINQLNIGITTGLNNCNVP
jgi:hypothetical protein